MQKSGLSLTFLPIFFHFDKNTPPQYSFLTTKTPPLPVFFPYDKRGFWAVEIPNKVTGSLTYKLVLFIPGDKQYHISKKQKLG